MAIKEELRELTALRRKRALLQKSMDGALARDAQAEYKRYKQECDAIDRTLQKNDRAKS